MTGDELDVIMKRRSRVQRKYAIRAVVCQEGEWLCAQCLEYDLVAQAKSLPKAVSRAARTGRRPCRRAFAPWSATFRDLPRAPAKYWAMFRDSRLAIPAPMFKLGALKTRGVVVAPPQVRIAVPSAAQFDAHSLTWRR